MANNIIQIFFKVSEVSEMKNKGNTQKNDLDSLSQMGNMPEV